MSFSNNDSCTWRCPLLNNNIVRRFGTAIVAGLPILWLLYYGPPLAWFLLCGAALIVAAYELARLDDQLPRLGQAKVVLGSLALFLLLIAQDPLHLGEFAAFLWVGPTVAVLSLLRLLADPHSVGRREYLRAEILWTGPFYLGGCVATIALIRTFGASFQGAGLCVFTMLVAWLSDAMAMLFGKTLKGPKLYEAVSPNKTWTGTIGGLTGSVLAAIIAHVWFLPGLPLGRGILLAFIAGAFGQVGDLCESVLKRGAGAKDSGALLPGHGGTLDRIDALMFTALVVYAALRMGFLPFFAHR